MGVEGSLEDLARRGREEAAAALRAADAGLKELAKLRRTLGKIAKKEWTGPKPIESALALLPEIGTLAATQTEVGSRLASARETAASWVKEEREGRRRRLAEGLKAACASANVTLLVVTKDPLELRLPPLGVEIDVEADRAVVLFGRVEVDRSRAEPGAILAARRKALAKLDEKGFAPETFHRDLREAYARALRAARKGPEDWIEMAEVLPEIAFRRQGARWRSDPTAANFRAYGKASLLFDLWRLRQARALVGDGWRLSLGPATGASTKDKRRVFWVEDGEGRGAYHLTMRFVRSSEIHGETAGGESEAGGAQGEGGGGGESGKD